MATFEVTLKSLENTPTIYLNATENTIGDKAFTVTRRLMNKGYKAIKNTVIIESWENKPKGVKVTVFNITKTTNKCYVYLNGNLKHSLNI